MHPRVRTVFKKYLSKTLPNSSRLRYLAHLPKIERWRNEHQEDYPLYDARNDLYDYINTQVLENQPICYLEFGVFEGETIKYWSEINGNAQSRYHGFDTFTGVPVVWESFTDVTLMNKFDVNGKIPRIEDGRVSFSKGYFQETLPGFLKTFEPSLPLVIHNDSDIYSSTMYMLTRCNDILVPGTIIIFDEFSSMLHEFRALEDYCESYMRSYDVIGATNWPLSYYPQVAIRMK